ncbi:MAG: hypothetical protein ACO1O1_17295 [Adhaeribacter sp.]
MMNDILPIRNFLTEIQGQPDFIYDRFALDHYAHLRESIAQAMRAGSPQLAIQQQALGLIEGLQGLIGDYEQNVLDAFEHLVVVTETEMQNLVLTYQQIKVLEQQVQALLAQVA